MKPTKPRWLWIRLLRSSVLFYLSQNNRF